MARADEGLQLWADAAEPDEEAEESSMIVAADAGRYKTIQKIIERDPSTDVDELDDDDDMSALYCAAQIGFFHAVRVLLEAGAKSDLKVKHGTTALTIAAGYITGLGVWWALKCLRPKLTLHAKIVAIPDYPTAACIYQRTTFFSYGFYDVCRILLEYKASPSFEDSEFGDTVSSANV